MNQLQIVFLVQSNARFIQDIQYIHQLGADLRGEADPLAFPSGKAPGTPVEGQIIQTNVQQEFQPPAQFFKDVSGNGKLAFAQALFNALEPAEEFNDVHTGQAGDVLSVQAEMEGFPVQPGTLANGTGDLPDVLVSLFLCPFPIVFRIQVEVDMVHYAVKT